MEIFFKSYRSAGSVSLLLTLLFLFQAQAQTISPLFTTQPVTHDSDDPAIWINKLNPEESLIIGTDKDEDGALFVFNSEGDIIANKVVNNVEKPNNVDVAYGLLLNNVKVDIAVTTERSTSKLRVYSLPNMEPVDGGGIDVFEGLSGYFDEPMGIALYTRPGDGKIYAIVGRKDGPTDGTYLWQYLLEDDGQGTVKGTLVRRFGEFSGVQEIESIAVDNELGYVYCSDETVGVRKYYADPDKGNQQLAFFATTGFEDDHEGIAIYKIDDGTGYILISDQEAEEVHIFPREGTAANKHAHPLIKVVSWEANDSDGIEVVNYPIPPYFMNGLVVAMSDNKTFHFYRWEDIAGDDLKIEPPGDETSILPPALASPANGATNVLRSPTLGWNASAEALFYRLQVSATADFSGAMYDQSNISDTEALVSGLSFNTVYYWRVKAYGDDMESDWSATRSFTTIADVTPPANPLVAYWKLDEGSGEVLIDASGQDNDASVVGNPLWIAGISGQALHISGLKKYAVVPDKASLDITEAITLAAWIIPRKNNRSQYIIKKAENEGSDGYELSLSGDGKVFFRINQASSGNTYRLNSIADYPARQEAWMHIAATYDGSAIRIYINGVENNMRVLNSPPSIGKNNLPLTIGSQLDERGQYQGGLDELRVYNTALTAAEIRELAIMPSLTGPGHASPAAAYKVSLAGVAEAGEISAYPNPFTSELMITFSVPEDGEYSVVLYDMKGKQLSMLKEGKSIAGETNTVKYNSADLAQGLYLLRLHTKEGSSTFKLVHDK
jgi:3-phytase